MPASEIDDLQQLQRDHEALKAEIESMKAVQEENAALRIEVATLKAQNELNKSIQAESSGTPQQSQVDLETLPGTTQIPPPAPLFQAQTFQDSSPQKHFCFSVQP